MNHQIKDVIIVNEGEAFLGSVIVEDGIISKITKSQETLSEKDWKGSLSISVGEIEKAFGKKLVTSDKFRVVDLWTGETRQSDSDLFEISELGACDNWTIRINPL